MKTLLLTLFLLVANLAAGSPLTLHPTPGRQTAIFATVARIVPEGIIAQATVRNDDTYGDFEGFILVVGDPRHARAATSESLQLQGRQIGTYAYGSTRLRAYEYVAAINAAAPKAPAKPGSWMFEKRGALDQPAR